MGTGPFTGAEALGDALRHELRAEATHVPCSIPGTT